MSKNQIDFGSNARPERYERKLQSRNRDARRFLGWINAYGYDCGFKSLSDYEAHDGGRFGRDGIWQTYVYHKAPPWAAVQKKLSNRKIRAVYSAVGEDEDVSLPTGSAYKRSVKDWWF